MFKQLPTPTPVVPGLTSNQRASNYTRQNRSANLTPRQRRRLAHKYNRTLAPKRVSR